jgi:cobalt-zinc-cadmium efflux system membrane fusion protein
VVERNVLVGQEVRGDAAQALLTITDLSTVWVLADVYEQDLALVTTGAEVAVRVPAYPNETFTGKVLYVGDVVDATTRTVKVRCVVPNLDGRLKPEMFAKVDLHDDGTHPTLRVPDKAVLLDGDKSEVVLAVKGKFRLRTVHTGPEVDGYIRILDGLEPGDVVVTEGALFIKRELQD